MPKKNKSSLANRITALNPKAKKSSSKKRIGFIGAASAAVIFVAGAFVNGQKMPKS